MQPLTIFPRWLWPLVFVAPLIMVGACASPPNPATFQPGEATLVGSRLSGEGALADTRVLVSAIDLKPTGRRRYDWDIPMRVAPGDHVIQVAAVVGDMTAEVAMRVALKPDGIYTARLRVPETDEPPALWLEDSATGTAVSNVIPVFASTFPPTFIAGPRYKR